MEKQINSKLSFLDLNIENTSGSFSFSVFRKATFTGLGMNYLSYCPLIYKINTFKTLLHRAYKLSSNYLNFTQEVEYLRNLFYNNSYPSDFFERQVYKFLYKIRQSPAELIIVERPSSFELSKKLTKILSHSYPQIEFNLCFKNNFSIKSLFKYKDFLPVELPILSINIISYFFVYILYFMFDLSEFNFVSCALTCKQTSGLVSGGNPH